MSDLIRQPLLVIGDVHGCLKTMLTLIDQHGEGRRIILLGDLIDRGPNSRGVVEWAMNNGIETLKGNHEDLALAYSGHDNGRRAKASFYYDRDVWLANGGMEALNSWDESPESVLPQRVLDWMADLPPFILIEEPTSEGRQLLCSHTGYGLDAKLDNRDGWLRALWGRHPDDGDFPDDGLFRVFGHNRGRQPIVTPAYSMVDTGAAYKGYGILTGMLWPERTIVQQPYID